MGVGGYGCEHAIERSFQWYFYYDTVYDTFQQYHFLGEMVLYS